MKISEPKILALIDAVDNLYDALQADLESGVRWLNEENSERFHRDYPELAKSIGQLIYYRTLLDDE